MLIDDAGGIKPYCPPSVEELTDSECRRLRTTVASVVESWRGAPEIGMRVGGLHRGHRLTAVDDDSSAVCFAADKLPVELRLSPDAAVSLLCVNLGARMAEQPDTRLSEVDLALLDAWAARALPALVDALDAGPGGEIRRRPAGSGREDGSVAVELTFAGTMVAGWIVIGGELARMDRGRGGDTLGEHPELLLHARIGVEARIVSEPVPMPELLSLECGDVLLLGDKTAIKAELTAGDAVVAAGRPGARDGVRALRIKGAVLNDREDRLGATSDGF
ncbi:MAG: FliM/FliN family flagellar motor switch protein [Armatimonadota bacterium]